MEYRPKNAFFHQLSPLLSRSFKNFYRLPSNQLNKIASAIMMPFLLGIMYFQIGNKAPADFELQYFLDLVAFYFMGIYFVFSFNTYDTILICILFPTKSLHKNSLF